LSKAEDIRAFLHWTVHPRPGPRATYLDPVGTSCHCRPHVVQLSDNQIAKIGRPDGGGCISTRAAKAGRGERAIGFAPRPAGRRHSGNPCPGEPT